MNVFRKITLVYKVLRWRLNWDWRDIDYAEGKPDHPLFVTPRQAVERFVRDGDFVSVSGLGGNQHATVLHFALRDVHAETGHPKDLTVMAIGGMGGRGRVPGTIDEVGQPGLCARFVTGHFETFKSVLKLADAGRCELQCLPQGTLSLLIEAQANGEESVLVPTGVGTVFDPEIGRGTPLAGTGAEQWVMKEGAELRYRIPPITCALIAAPGADREGNIYIENAAMIAEIPELVRAVKRNGGRVIVNVGTIVDHDPKKVFVKAEDVDAVVYYPRTGQCLLRTYDNPWDVLLPHSATPMDEAIEEVRFINNTLGVTPKRNDADKATGRLAASIFAEHAWEGALVNIGTGLPEEVCREIYEGGLLDKITFFTESGVVGGVPNPGAFFGTAVKPDYMTTSAKVFHRAHEELDVTCLGTLQVDSLGNVNVSKRGEGAINYVGPGGFIDFSTSAKMVIFIGAWMAHSKLAIEDGKLKILERGKPKFIEQVDEITFSGPEALKAGRKVFYVTNVGVFQLTERGLTLIRVMPGADIQKDIIDFAPAKIVLPESGDVPVVDRSVVTGKDYSLQLTGSRPKSATPPREPYPPTPAGRDSATRP